MKTRRSRLANLFDLLLLFGAVVALYPQVGRPETISPGGDMVNLMLPARHWAALWLGRGIIPLWNPMVFGGVPFLGAMQAAVLYPPNVALGAVLSPLATINLLRLAHIYLFGALTWLFLRIERGLGRPAALLGALAVSGSAHVASHIEHINQLAAMAWLPALVTCLWRYWRKGSARALVVLTALVAVQNLAGHPQAVFYSFLLCAAVALAWFIRGAPWRRETEPLDGAGSGQPRRRLAQHLARRAVPLMLCAGALGGGLLLAAVQLLPTAETARFSRRSADGPDYPLWGSMPRRFLVTLIAPRAFGDPLRGYTDRQFGSECNAYVGRVTLVLAVGAVATGFAARRRYALFWALVVAGALALALGGYGPFADPAPRGWKIFGPFPPATRPSPFFQAYLWLFPPARHLRMPPRIMLLAVFGLAVLGAEGLDWFCRKAGRMRRPSRTTVAVAAWLVVAALAVELWLFQRREFHNRVVAYQEPRSWLDAQARRSLAPLLQSAQEGNELPEFRLFRLMVRDPDYLMDVRPEAIRNRWRRLQPNLGMMLGVAQVEGYEEGLLPPLRYFDFLSFFNRNLRNPDPDAVLLGLMNVRYLYAEHGLAVRSKTWRPAGEVIEPGPGGENASRHYRLYENPLWLPRVVWRDYLPREIVLEALRGAYSRGGPPLRERLGVRQRYGFGLEGLLKRGYLVDQSRLETLRVSIPDPNRIIVDNPTRRGGTLFVSQNPYPGWVVDVGGRVSEVRPLTDFAGVAKVEAGAERFEIAYRPFSFRLGAYLSALALSLWSALAVVAFAPRRAGCNAAARESSRSSG